MPTSQSVVLPPLTSVFEVLKVTVFQRIFILERFQNVDPHKFDEIESDQAFQRSSCWPGRTSQLQQKSQ